MFDSMLLIFPLFLALLATWLGFPPLIGYLAAGFALYASGIDALPFLQPIADLGVLLLLFAIGLKLDLRSLTRIEIWGSASIHMLLTVVIGVVFIKILTLAGMSMLEGISLQQTLILVFAFSFSSTVFAIKMLEESGETQSLYGRTAIGILIMQDLFAVLYITFSKGILPSPWALSLLALPLLRPLFYRLFDRIGHGEMVVLFGLMMALVPGAALFEAVGLKPDLGALLLGILLSGHAKASELSKSLFLFKELFLVAFFLTIGQQGLPSSNEILMALALMLLLPIKLGLFMLLLTRLHLRLRSALMASVSLGNFSEFGLIVMTAAIASGSLEASWLRVMALMVAFSFVLAAPLSNRGQGIYQKVRASWSHLERHPLHPEDRPIQLGTPSVLIFGMGRIGSGAYDELHQHFGDTILGIDHKQDIIDKQLAAGRKVVQGDATDTDFWDKLEHSDSVELVVLAMPHHQGNLFTAEQLARIQFKGKVAAISHWPDEVTTLQELGIDWVYNMYQAAGTGLAEHIVTDYPALKKPASANSELEQQPKQASY